MFQAALGHRHRRAQPRRPLDLQQLIGSPLTVKVQQEDCRLRGGYQEAVAVKVTIKQHTEGVASDSISMLDLSAVGTASGAV